ncbi:hypothetical protein NUW58_g4187 [Xylaria curta]|uniref:Uncharacterized protein n=1 Tax=Xylaria curta TaxID=42375 RepID=A0ACC1PA79_9PEZI|nr:hypothetical protein NUW58_g4187 [Xylaria curta]
MLEYQQLDLSGSDFRLVRLQKDSGIMIECELIHTTLDDNVIPYEAVSYTWGTLDRTRNIFIDGDMLHVTSNLSRLLRDLRSCDIDRYLWIDAICINQDDDLERGHQVQRMKHIYRGAERVLFYLCPKTEIASVLMESLAQLQERVAGVRWEAHDTRWDAAWQEVQERLRGQYENLEFEQREGLGYLLRRSFFRRVWILQEVANSRRASVLCGTDSVPAHLFAISPRLMNITTDPHVQAVLHLMPGSFGRTTRSFPGRSLLALLKQFGGSEASDERDRIYALLGLCEVTNKATVLTPDYTASINTVLERTLSYIFGSVFPDFLQSAENVDELIYHLNRPCGEVIPLLLVSNHRVEWVFDYIGSVNTPIEIPEYLAIDVLRYLVQSLWPPTHVLNHYFTRLGMKLNIPHGIVSSVLEVKWSADILKLLLQYGRKVQIYARPSFIIETRRTELLKFLVRPCKADVAIRVTMKGLWVVLLLVPDDGLERLISLLDGVRTRTKTAIIHLRQAASESPGAFRSSDATMLLWRLASNRRNGHPNNSTLINGRDCLVPKRRLSLDDDRMAVGPKGMKEVTTSILRHHLSKRLINMNPHLDYAIPECGHLKRVSSAAIARYETKLIVVDIGYCGIGLCSNYPAALQVSITQVMGV